MNSLASISYKGLTGHWSKYGGNHHDVFQRQGENFENWYCQSCGREMTKEMFPYFFQLPDGEFIRICAICEHDKAKEYTMKEKFEESFMITTTIYIKETFET